MVVRLIVSYRGAAYAGWQRQANALAVQEVLEEALGRLLGSPVRAVGASRTDAGVHARGQAAHLEPAAAVADWPLRGLVHGTNHLLPDDVRVLAADRMAAGFHARRAARGKEYCYRLSRAAVLSPLDAPYVLRVPARIDAAAMAAAASALVGRHDFSAFALAGGSHTQPFRTVASAAIEEIGEAGEAREVGAARETGAELRFRVVGDGFLRGMVRAMVGTLLEVGLGRRPPEDVAALLGGAARGAAGATAPPHGLVLEQVLYPPEWQPLPS
ncbi:MAG TPA: tRNA pseudouridine(38-40) synthase TruA [Thermoanaerobaculia bacterium]|jgi:tRNA pseudouridine38-40 synthase|nr:tRNA pseudouridine(38-40) synthase TruA [Thermoanaerobaculia bacterium]